MKNLIKPLILLTIALFNFWTPPMEAAFEQVNTDAPGLAVCEVNCYSEYSLRQEYFYTLEQYLIEELQTSKKFRVEDKLSFTPTLADGSVIDLDQFFKELHQHAIINGKNFQQEEANPEFAEYWELHPGKKSTKEAYILDQDFKHKVAYLGKQNNVKYLVFCNLKFVDVKVSSHTMLSAIESIKGLKIKVDMDYYLVNTENGIVYEGNSITDKGTQLLNFILIKTGKAIDIQQLVEAMLKAQAKRASEDICSKGLSMVKK